MRTGELRLGNCCKDIKIDRRLETHKKDQRKSGLRPGALPDPTAVRLASACGVWWLPASAVLPRRPPRKEDRRPEPPSIGPVSWAKSSSAGQTRQDHRRTRRVTPLLCHCGEPAPGVGLRTSGLPASESAKRRGRVARGHTCGEKRIEVRGPRSEVRGPRSEVRGPRSEVRGPRSAFCYIISEHETCAQLCQRQHCRRSSRS